MKYSVFEGIEEEKEAIPLKELNQCASNTFLRIFFTSGLIFSIILSLLSVA